ncbi:MAG: histidinol dehydrogenase, partial [Actinomycetia bacterium]|nr:histidinol dehydrogenase [Actinomycetes bacterium]
KPIERVGVYVPGGTASYPSSVLMNIIPAQIAGVEEIAVCIPPGKNGNINKYVLAALDFVKEYEVYRVGGAQAIAALAYGTQTIKKVSKITGPGNIYVALAKKEVYGVVDIDMIAGPSEILIIADESADSMFIAADMLAQAEHDQDAISTLVTNSENIAKNTIKELKKQIEGLKRKDITKKAIKNNGKILVIKDIDDAVEIANYAAPEHLEIMVKNPKKLLKKIKNAGSIFLGNNTPEVAGDYVAGPNHILPTSSTARFFSPLSTESFLKKSSFLELSKNGLKKMIPHIKVLASIEGLDAHAKAAEIREEDK